MVKNIFLTGLIAILALGAVSCGELEKEVPKGEMVFELYEDSYLIEGPLNFTFGEEKTLRLHSWFVTTMEISEPEGWGAAFYRNGDDGTVIIIAPANESIGVPSGDIEIELAGYNGQRASYTVQVAAY